MTLHINWVNWLNLFYPLQKVYPSNCEVIFFLKELTWKDKKGNKFHTRRANGRELITQAEWEGSTPASAERGLGKRRPTHPTDTPERLNTGKPKLWGAKGKTSGYDLLCRQVRAPPKLPSHPLWSVDYMCPPDLSLPQEVGDPKGRVGGWKGKECVSVLNHRILTTTSSSTLEHAEPCLLILCSLSLARKLKNSFLEKKRWYTDVCEPPREKPLSPLGHLIQKLNSWRITSTPRLNMNRKYKIIDIWGKLYT